MSLFRIDTTEKRLAPIQSSSYASQEWWERRDLQPLLRDNPAAIDPNLMVIAEEFADWEGIERRADLLALDRQGNLVIIELKTVDGGGHMDLQGLRYTAMVSSMEFDGVLRTYKAHLEKLKRPPDDADQALVDWLGPDPVISRTPHLVLVAPSFSTEITTTVLWLNEQGLSIRCVQANLYSLENGSLYLDISQIIPLPQTIDYQIKIREKEKAQQKSAQRRERRADTLPILVQTGVLKQGTRIHLIKPPRAGMAIPDGKAKHATCQDPNTSTFQWDYDGQPYLLSPLCRRLCEEFGGAVGAGAFRGSMYWAIEGEEISLLQRTESAAETEPTVIA